LTPELRRKLDRLVLMERLEKLRDWLIVLAILALAYLLALYLRATPLAKARLGIFVCSVEAGAVLAAVILTLLGYRKLAVRLIFGDRRGRDDETKAWFRRRRPPPIAQVETPPTGRAVDWRLESSEAEERASG